MGRGPEDIFAPNPFFPRWILIVALLGGGGQPDFDIFYYPPALDLFQVNYVNHEPWTAWNERLKMQDLDF